MKFNEDSRVKIPAILHLTRLGYSFLPKAVMKRANIHPETNIFLPQFKAGISKINKNNNEEFSETDFNSFLTEINYRLDNNDLGRAFYKGLLGDFPCKLIDFENFENNLFHIVTELVYKNGEEEFRPDITVLINGLPLVFIEVKKPNNAEGMLAEKNRIETRFRNLKFKKFMNITQLLIFSNNNEYDDGATDPVLGAFYATPDPEKVNFNPFREENNALLQNIPAEDMETENLVLKDTNLVSIIGTAEYNTNKNINTPTNRILTSLLSKERLKMILKYGIAYVKREQEKVGSRIEKHIMRYPQFFATLAIENKVRSGTKKRHHLAHTGQRENGACFLQCLLFT